MKFRKRHVHTEEEIKAAAEATEKSAKMADEDLVNQRHQLEEERKTVTPTIKRLHDNNHVAEALIKLIEMGRRE